MKKSPILYTMRDVKTDTSSFSKEKLQHFERITSSKPILDTVVGNAPLKASVDPCDIIDYREENGIFSFAVGFARDTAVQRPECYVRGYISEIDKMTHYYYCLNHFDTGSSTYWNHDLYKMQLDNKEVRFLEITQFDSNKIVPYYAEVQEQADEIVSYDIPINVRSSLYHDYQCQNLQIRELCSSVLSSSDARMQALDVDVLGEIKSHFGKRAYQKKVWVKGKQDSWNFPC